ncbi:MAG: urease accessory protein UreD [Siphonobacter aquaeclarae]|nr:urease accessory protein UreD [Siphonobacter aquaeclarae]
MQCRLHVTVGHKNGRSYARDIFAGKPFRAMPVGQYAADNALHLMLMSVSPGILDGDHYDVRFDLDAHARLRLEAQSYQRLYTMNTRATQEMTITLAPGSDFAYVPYPVVPHRDSTFISKTRVELHPGARFLLGEIITCGRKLSGERFEYTRFQNLVEVVTPDGTLLLKDNVVLVPAAMPLTEIGLLEGYTHQGTLICLGQEDDGTLLDRLHDELATEAGITFGISATRYPGFVLRILGSGGEQLHRCFERIRDIIWEL